MNAAATETAMTIATRIKKAALHQRAEPPAGPLTEVGDGDSHLAIQEQIPHGRRWPWPKVEKLHKDYAVVTRLVNSATGQFTVIVAGCSGSGTEAAGEFVTNDEILAEGVQSLPAGWQNRNLQLVLETHVADGTPEPAKVIASYSW